MRVLVATRELQGQRANDFCWAEEGELVCFPFECDGEEIDGGCGCRRSFGGLRTHACTTTAKCVNDPEMTRERFREVYAASMRDAGWPLSPGELLEQADELVEVARKSRLGGVFEKRGSLVVERRR